MNHIIKIYEHFLFVFTLVLSRTTFFSAVTCSSLSWFVSINWYGAVPGEQLKSPHMILGCFIVSDTSASSRIARAICDLIFKRPYTSRMHFQFKQSCQDLRAKQKQYIFFFRLKIVLTEELERQRRRVNGELCAQFICLMESSCMRNFIHIAGTLCTSLPDEYGPKTVTYSLVEVKITFAPSYTLVYINYIQVYCYEWNIVTKWVIAAKKVRKFTFDINANKYKPVWKRYWY